MKKHFTIILLTVASVFVCTSATHRVLVGQGGGLTFSPSSFSVAVGDTVSFIHLSGSHTTTSVSVPQGASSWSSAISPNVMRFDYVVTHPGEYSYMCDPHNGAGMTGTFSTLVSKTTENQIRIKSTFSISPNPATSHANVEFQALQSFKGSMRLYDSQGNLALEDKLKVEVGANSVSINLEKLNPGIYYLNLLDKNEAFLAEKLIKQ